MRLLVDLRSHLTVPEAPKIIQVQKVPVQGTAGREATQGKYVIPMPLGVDFPITSSDYILDGGGNIDGGGVVSKGMAHLLAAFPMFDNIYFNPMLTSDHVGELVLDQSFHFTDKTLTPAATFYPRFQTGRESGVADEGQIPTHTALFPNNALTTPGRPGLILTDAIDIGPYTLDCNSNPVGTDEFMVWWQIYKFSHSHDIAANFGLNAGINSPASRFIEETDQEPANFSVYISTDNGGNWCAAGLLEPMAFCDKTKSIRLAFRNDSTDKLYLASFALLF